jgi:3-dehydroquinate synthase class II
MNEWCLEKKKKNICSTDWVVINRYDWDNQKDRVETILKCGFKLQNTTESYVTVVKDIFSFTKRTHRLEIYKKSK